MELLLIRHGLPVRIERADGAPADPPLSQVGRGQSQRVARWLAAQPIDVIVSSPMVRAFETAQPLAEIKGCDIQIEPGVRELDADSESYIPLEELKEQDYEAWKAAMASGPRLSSHSRIAIETATSIKLSWLNCLPAMRS